MNEAEAPKNVSVILLNATNSADAIRALYELKKESDAKYSLQWLAKKAKVPSKSNLSDVMKGRRKLSPKHAVNLSQAFGLEGIYATYFSKLVERESIRNARLRELADKEIELLKKAIRIEVIESQLDVSPFALHVFCALGLFGNQATLEQLARYFKSKSAKEVASALEALSEKGFVVHSRGKFSPRKDQISFAGNATGDAEWMFLSQSLEEAKESIKTYARSESALFNSTIISVQRQVLEQELRKFKESLFKMHGRLESEQADTLIRFNVQVYPIGAE